MKPFRWISNVWLLLSVIEKIEQNRLRWDHKKNWNFEEFQLFMIFEKLCFSEFYNQSNDRISNDRIFKHHLLGQEDRFKCIIWVRTWLRAHTVSIKMNLKNQILVILTETFGGGTISARATTRALIWCAPIYSSEQGDNFWVFDCYRSSKTCYCSANWS